MNQDSTPSKIAPALFIGIDWADQAHDCYIIDAQGKGQHQKLKQSPEAIDLWVKQMLELSGGQPIAIMLEQSKGPLIYALTFRPDVFLYPVNPKQFARYRESYPGGDAKSDPSDARYIARMLRERISTLKPWIADDQETRRLSNLSEQRRKIVNNQVSDRQQLISYLKSYFPKVLEVCNGGSRIVLMLKMVSRWSDPRKLKRADRQLVDRVLKENGVHDQSQREQFISHMRKSPLLTSDAATIEPLAMACKLLAKQIEASRETVKAFDQQIDKALKSHPDGDLFATLKGAGPTLAARLLCAFGSQKDRWDDADQIASLSGIAPVTRQSGKSRVVLQRWACPAYLKQTFHEFADSARKFCPWTKARYLQLKDRGMKHNAAVRKLARSWIRILFRVWKTGIKFDCQKYLQQLLLKNPELANFVQKS
ncbi:IS110 family transposase [Mariniblastus sp.]|nr:IS110 family transposase [Mariniblastus sp.]